MNQSSLAKLISELYEQLNDSDAGEWTITKVDKETLPPEPKTKYTARALDFLYNQDYDQEHQNLYTEIVRIEKGEYRFYRWQWKGEEGLYIRETITGVCDLLDKGMPMRDIARKMDLHFDTVCRIRIFFEEDK